MKRILFFFVTVMAYTIGMSQVHTFQMPPGNNNSSPRAYLSSCPTQKMMKIANFTARLANENPEEEYTFNYGYCYNPYRLSTLGAGRNYAAILLTADNLKQYEGCRVTEIGVVTGYNTQDEKNHIEDVTVFLTYGLDEEPFAQVTGKYEAAPGEWNYIKLDEAFEIDGQVSFYIGYYYDAPTEDDLGLIFDGMWPWPGLGDLVAYGENYNDLEWGSADNLGALCIKAKLEGTNLPHDQLTINSSNFPYNVIPNEPIECELGLYNTGVNEITSVDVHIKIGNAEPIIETIALEDPLIYQGMGSIKINVVCTEEGNIPFSIGIPTVNGGKTNLSPNRINCESQFLCLTEGFKRNVLCEEGTGTWCGFCPQGIVGISWMKKNYTDGTFIPVAVHLSGSQMQLDPLDVVGIPYDQDATIEEYCYRPMVDHFFAVPTAYINRVYNNNRDIGVLPESLETAYLKWKNIPALTEIDGEIVWIDDDKHLLKLSTNTQFIVNEENADYRVGYIITENNVGPYIQTNYFSGGDYGEMYGWEDKPQMLECVYDEVARNCSRPYGFERSLPSDITKGETYSFETVIELSDVENVENCHVVAVVVNNNTGVVENACYITKISDSVVVDSVILDEEETQWYNLQGIRLDAPVKNMPIIKRSGTKTEKVFLTH